jgi:hypothetical protein
MGTLTLGTFGISRSTHGVIFNDTNFCGPTPRTTTLIDALRTKGN